MPTSISTGLSASPALCKRSVGFTPRLNGLGIQLVVYFSPRKQIGQGLFPMKQCRNIRRQPETSCNVFGPNTDCGTPHRTHGLRRVLPHTSLRPAESGRGARLCRTPRMPTRHLRDSFATQCGLDRKRKAGQLRALPAADLQKFNGGRNRVRTCGPFRVKEVRSRCAIRPYVIHAP